VTKVQPIKTSSVARSVSITDNITGCADAGGFQRQGNSSVGGLKTLLMRSLAWAGAAKGVTSLGTSLRFLIFARLLTPYDFGVMGAANFCELLLNVIFNPSFEVALVAQSGDIGPYLDTLWATMLVRATVMAALLIAAAKPLAACFRIPHDYAAFYAVAGLAFSPALKSPGSTALLARNLDFHISVVLNSAEFVSSLVVGVAAILYWHDWRGLFAALYAGDIARVALTYWFFPYRPHFRFDPAKARTMFTFGRWATLRSVAKFAAKNIDKLAVGHMLGARALGEYQMAFRFGELPASEFADIASMVSFPLVARHSRDPQTCKRLLTWSSLTVLAGGLGYLLFALAAGPMFMSMTVGAKWLGAFPLFKVLCLYGLLCGLTAVCCSVLDGLNQPEKSFSISLLNTAVLALAIYPLTLLWGAMGAAVAAVIAIAAPLPLLYRYAWSLPQATRPAEQTSASS
jgi:O-antigen/teichoic acid export membrane protein